jgi:hypothetical protein
VFDRAENVDAIGPDRVASSSRARAVNCPCVFDRIAADDFAAVDDIVCHMTDVVERMCDRDVDTC